MPNKSNIDKKELAKLRKAVKYLLVDKGLDLRGGQKRLAKEINVYGKTLNSSITGYLSTTNAQRILEKARRFLISLPDVDE